MPAAREDSELVAAVRDGLAARADPARAPGMQAYMKSAMPFRGVVRAGQYELERAVFGAHELPDVATWAATIRTLFHAAAYREERYVAVDLLGHARYRAFRTPAILPLCAELIAVGAWWDLVDPIATRTVGGLLRQAPGEVEPVLRGWSTDDDLWLRRTSIIAQVNARDETDLELLVDCIEPNRADRDFFIRKAIGWALRAYAWVDADAVRTYVAGHELSGLSRREALKNVGGTTDVR